MAIMIAGTILTFVTCVAVSGLYYGAERREQDTKYIPGRRPRRRFVSLSRIVEEKPIGRPTPTRPVT